MTEGIGSGAFFLERDGVQTLALLNEALELDRDAMSLLFRTRVAVNSEFAANSGIPTSQNAGVHSVALLSVINAVLRVNGLPLITAHYSNEGDDMRLNTFASYHPVR